MGSAAASAAVRRALVTNTLAPRRDHPVRFRATVPAAGCRHVLSVGRTFLSAGSGDFQSLEPVPDWKVRRTGRLESQPYTLMAAR